ncbi:hypothetical protein RLEG12_08005 (plasmid) [Rhizobium leguminosarum bv. trifolii CB782]|nr:hypothetical protein RLEG12_08005 [Rhizobium leguminosarum bv. trifolii CB782]
MLGGGLILALSFLSLITMNDAALSGLCQGVGYLLAATGPIMIGLFQDQTGGWGAPLTLCSVLSDGMALVRLLAGRNQQKSWVERC